MYILIRLWFPQKEEKKRHQTCFNTVFVQFFKNKRCFLKRYPLSFFCYINPFPYGSRDIKCLSDLHSTSSFIYLQTPITSSQNLYSHCFCYSSMRFYYSKSTSIQHPFFFSFPFSNKLINCIFCHVVSWERTQKQGYSHRQPRSTFRTADWTAQWQVCHQQSPRNIQN